MRPSQDPPKDGASITQGQGRPRRAVVGSVKHYCPVCGSFMGFTHGLGDVVFCSFGEDEEGPCADFGFAEHPEEPWQCRENG